MVQPISVLIIKITILVCLNTVKSNSSYETSNFVDYTDYYYDTEDDEDTTTTTYYKTVELGDLSIIECGSHCKHPYWLHWFTWLSNDSVLLMNHTTRNESGFYTCKDGPHGATCREYMIVILNATNTTTIMPETTALSTDSQADEKMLKNYNNNNSKAIWQKVEQINRKDVKVAFDAAEFGFRKVFHWFDNRMVIDKKKMDHLARSSVSSLNYSKWNIVVFMLVPTYYFAT